MPKHLYETTVISNGKSDDDVEFSAVSDVTLTELSHIEA